MDGVRERESERDSRPVGWREVIAEAGKLSLVSAERSSVLSNPLTRRESCGPLARSNIHHLQE